MQTALCVSLLLFLCESGNILYIGQSDNVNYNAAKASCSSLQLSTAQLATWGSGAEFAQIAAVRAQLENHAWVGLDDINAEGKWRFVDNDASYCGGDCDNIPQWGDGEPNDYKGEDCAENHILGYLNDRECSDKIPYICELKFNMDIDHISLVSEDHFQPIYAPGEQPNNYYVLEFTSIKDMVIVFSIVLNVVLVSCVFYEAAFRKRYFGFSKVKMYEDEAGDEKL